MTIKAEQEHHKRAFEAYYALGAKRTYEKVAVELGVSASTVKLWSRSFSWSTRIAERDATAARQIADQSLQSTVDELGRNKKIVQMALVRLAKAIANGQIKMQMGDLDRLIRLQSHLDGYVEGQTWDTLSMEVLARRFYWVLNNVSTEEFVRFHEEYKRLDQSNGGGMTALEPPP
jgi:transposase